MKILFYNIKQIKNYELNILFRKCKFLLNQYKDNKKMLLNVNLFKKTRIMLNIIFYFILI